MTLKFHNSFTKDPYTKQLWQQSIRLYLLKNEKQGNTMYLVA